MYFFKKPLNSLFFYVTAQEKKKVAHEVRQLQQTSSNQHWFNLRMAALACSFHESGTLDRNNPPAAAATAEQT